MSGSRSRFWRAVLVSTSTAALALLAYKLFVPFELAYNTTASIPRGLYLARDVQVQDLKRGDTVCFAYQPPTWATERNYFERGRRLCKYMLGLPGDGLEVGEGAVRVKAPSGEVIQMALAQADSKGRPLPDDALVSGEVPIGHVLALAPAYANSLDSRYLGPVPVNKLTHQIWPIWLHD